MATRKDLDRPNQALPIDRFAWAALDLAPYDDEPVNAEDRATMAEAEIDWRGAPCPSIKVLAEPDDRDRRGAD